MWPEKRFLFVALENPFLTTTLIVENILKRNRFSVSC